MSKYLMLFSLATIHMIAAVAQPRAKPIAKDATEIKVAALLAKMTFAEYTNDRELTRIIIPLT